MEKHFPGVQTVLITRTNVYNYRLYCVSTENWISSGGGAHVFLNTFFVNVGDILITLNYGVQVRGQRPFLPKYN